jgi:uncharacterized repeat protein (TIGR03803 family)
VAVLRLQSSIDIKSGVSPRLIAAGLFCAFVVSCGGGDGSGGGTAQPFTTIYCFGGSSTDALGPNGALIQGSDGNFYGTTTGGGIGGGPQIGAAGFPGNGTVFKITPTGEETVLHSFSQAEGINPDSLIQGSDGNFYGTTYRGGANGTGTVFKLTPEGVETTLYSFGSEGGPLALLQGSDGNFYGVAADGGGGFAFQLTPGGVLTTLSGVPYGPTGRFLQGSDGSFYGTSFANSGNGLGDTVFKVGAPTLLHSFSGPPADGDAPYALVQGNDGNLYGTTRGGGANCSDLGGCGTAYKLTPDGTETILHSFNDQSDGAYPFIGLIQGSDGNFYGTTLEGGMNAGGAIFQLTPAGVVTLLYSLPDGSQPQSQLLQGSDGNLYGTTYQNGTYRAGCFYRFDLSTH